MKAALFAIVAASGLQATLAAAHAKPVPVAIPDDPPVVSASYELPSTTASSSPSPSSSSSTAPAPPSGDYPSGLGICYSPYNDDGSCKNQKEVNSDFELLTEYSLIRIYGVDCDQVSTVLTAAKQTNKKVFAGLFDINSLEQDLETIISAAEDSGSDWSTINTVSVGNELVNQGAHSVSEITNAIRTARSTLRSAGYDGPVVTVDTFNALISNPELCQASDYCAANCHPFFDPNTSAEDAGSFVAEQAQLVSDSAGGDKVTVITETGWPSQGSTNGKAIPSKENQQIAVESLKKTLKSGEETGLYLMSAFDTKWKADHGGTFATEKYWGIEE